MDNLENIKNIYFLGIGGIGMSSLARYFQSIGKTVVGYDRAKTQLTISLVEEGIDVHYDDNIAQIPAYLHQNDTLVIYTPAIPDDHIEFNWLKEKGFNILKRAKVLGILCSSNNCMAVAGTHGKTTVSTMLAVILKESLLGCGAFLGGISKNYDTNTILPENEDDWIVAEADEYDRSFLNLFPKMALITSMDADHLDIYGEHEEVEKSFSEFVSQIKPEGNLVIKKGLELGSNPTGNLKIFTYSLDEKADFYATNLKLENEAYTFNLQTPMGQISGIRTTYPGLINVENAIGAAALALLAGVTTDEVKKGVEAYQGVQRRFDIKFRNTNTIFIDDYAHHPEELNAVISSVKKLFPEKEITGIFQPHLYTRTRDFAKEFAQSLSLLDQIILLPIYPARELPIEGVTSQLIGSYIDHPSLLVMDKNEVLEWIKINKTEVLLTLGAGDIDKVADEMLEIVKAKNG